MVPLNMCPAGEPGGVAVTRVYLLVVGLVLIAACGHTPVAQSPTGQQSAVASSQAAGCDVACQQAGNSAGTGKNGYPCASPRCLPCPPRNCVTVQSSGATASNGVATVQLTCNLSTKCVGAFLLCLPETLCETRPTGDGSGGRLGGAGFTGPPRTTGNVTPAGADDDPDDGGGE